MPGYADIEDPVTLLNREPDTSGGPTVEEAIREAGFEVQVVNWIWERVVGTNLVESIITPITGDFEKIAQQAGQWENICDALQAIRNNLNAGLGELRPAWQGSAADQFRDLIGTKWTLGIEADAQAAKLIGFALKKVAEGSRRACDEALELIRKLVGKLIEAAAMAPIPVVGWGRAVKLVYDGIQIYNAIMQLIEGIRAIIEGAQQVIQGVQQVGTALSKLDDISNLNDALNVANEAGEGVANVAGGVGSVRDGLHQTAAAGADLADSASSARDNARGLADERAAARDQTTSPADAGTTTNGDSPPGQRTPATGTEEGANDGGPGQRSDGNGGCDGKGGDPVDTVTGQVIVNGVDVDLPALLPLVLQRAYASGYHGGRLHGPGWSSTLDQRLEIDGEYVRYFGDDAQILRWEHTQAMPVDGARWPLTVDGDTYRIEDPKTGWVRHFGPNPAAPRVRPITAVTDRNGNRITYERDGNGLPVQVSHSGGYRVGVATINGEAGPRIAALVMGADILVEYRYDQRGRLTGIVDETRVPYRYTYDEADRVTGWIDRAGHHYRYTYGADGRVVRGDGVDGYLSSEFAYDLAARTTTVTDSLGGTTVFHYDEHNHLTKVVDPLGNTELTEYDRYHRLLSRTDALGNTTRYTRNADGDPVRIERPDGTVVTATYNHLRRATEVVAPDGARWQYSYDERGNIVTHTDPAGAVTTHTHGERGEPRTITDALGNTTTITTNAAGLPVAVSDASGATEAYVLDGRGRLVRVTDPLGAVTTIEWGATDSPARYTYPDGTSQTWVTDGNGDVVAMTDRAGFTTRYEIGPFHMVSARVDPDGARHTFTHDTELRLTGVTNPQGLVWRYVYDPAGNLLAEQDFNGRAVSYEHDAAKRMVRLTNGAGETISITRDVFGRPVAQHTGDGEETRFGYDAAGRMLTATGPDAEVVFTRDPVGRLLSETVNGATLTATYDLLGRRTSRTTPGGHTSAWQYDRVGLPATLTTGGRRLTFGHDAARREVYRWLSADVALTSAWDSSGRLTDRQLVGVRTHEGGRMSRPLSGRHWTYRPDGVPDSTSDSTDGERRFDLDPVGRVTAVRAASWSESYAYDPSGNLTFAADNRAGDSPVIGPRANDGTLLRRAGRSHYDYDAQGRLTRTVRHTLSGTRHVWTYRYDTRGRITETVNPAGQRWRYRYDPLGRRIAKQRLAADDTVAEEVRFHWDGQVLAEQEQDTNGTVTTTTWDHEPGTWTPISQSRRTAAADAPQHVIDQRFHAIVTDLVGTPTELVTADGRVDWRHRTNLWGEERQGGGTVDCPLRFPGQYHDRETGLYYNYHRYYDPSTGRYTGPDPLGLDAAPNHHGYVENPLALLDPLGLIAKDRYLHMDREGWSNYVLRDANGTAYYSGMFGPNTTLADVEARHAANHNRYDPANGDTIETVPGTRTYGESRLMEQRLADQYGTVIGRDGNDYRGNRQNPMDEDKVAEYEEYEDRKKNGLGCP